jgi:predicted Zn-dependent peptidase
MTRDRMWEYFRQRYAPDNMLLIVAGRVDPRQIIGLAEDLCGSWPASGTASRRDPPALRAGVDVLQVDRFKQQIVCLTHHSVSAADDLAETASAACTILGGDNSRFFWNIVQAGISPRAGAHHLEYTDCGAVLLYGACQPDKVERLVDAMRREAKLVCSDRVQEHEVERVKNRRRTGLALESEAPYHRLTHLMDDMEYRGAPRTVDQMLADVDAVSVDTILEYFQRFPISAGGHLASVGPRRWPDGD